MKRDRNSKAKQTPLINFYFIICIVKNVIPVFSVVFILQKSHKLRKTAIALRAAILQLRPKVANHLIDK